MLSLMVIVKIMVWGSVKYLFTNLCFNFKI